MAIQAKKQSPWFLLLLLAASLAMWAIDQRKGDPPQKPAAPRTEQSSTGKPRTSKGVTEQQGGYEVYHGATLVPHKNNDGDSFMVRLPDGREAMMRLYYVDTPESAFKTYRGGADNHERIREQARDFGNISPERAVEIGKAAKEYTLDQLAKSPFTVFTRWDSPFNDERYHAFIELSGEKPRWLHEQLLRKGLARLKTKPAPLPDGTSVEAHRRVLEEARQQAIRGKSGGWGR